MVHVRDACYVAGREQCLELRAYCNLEEHLINSKI